MKIEISMKWQKIDGFLVGMTVAYDLRSSVDHI